MRVTLSGKKWETWIQVVHRPEGKPEDLRLGANRRAAQTSEAAAKPLVFLSGLSPLLQWFRLLDSFPKKTILNFPFIHLPTE